MVDICFVSTHLIRPHSSFSPLPLFSGNIDMVVNYRMAEKSKEAVTAKGCKSYTLKTYPIGHTVNNEETRDLLGFFQTILPDDPSFRIKLKSPSEMSVKELKAAIQKAGLQQKAVGLMEKHEFVKLVQDHRDGKL
jgi:hypothetical protein